jgi:outer membrane protein OmpA-like peptidoglycan-associated protein
VALIAFVGLASFVLAPSPDSVGEVGTAAHIVYTAPTANDAALSIPDDVRAQLRQIGLRQERIAMTRVDSTSEVATSIIDLAPRAGTDPNSPVLKVHDRAVRAIDAEISALEASMNATPASTGNRALFLGLTRISFSGEPVIIISSGLDLTSPLDFRTLNWSVPSQKIVAIVRQAGELPDFRGAPVTFVAVPTAGEQEQLRAAQKTYRNQVWTALLWSGSASSVTLLEAAGSTAASSIPAPVVELPPPPGTPVQPVHDPVNPDRTLCSLSGSTYFRFDEAVLIDEARTIEDLEPCVRAALAVDATFELDGWTSYEGPLAADGAPAIDSPHNRTLSAARAMTIADLLVRAMQVPPRSIARVTGHGNVGQPHPDPRNPANRVVVLSYNASE